MAFFYVCTSGASFYIRKVEYLTFQPKAPVDAFVKCYWTLTGEASLNPGKQTIVPDGCMELIVHLGDLYKQYLPDGTFIIQPRCFVFGQIQSGLEIEPTGSTNIFAVRFHPHGLYPLISFHPSLMNDRALPLSEVFGQEGAQLEIALLNAPDTRERIQTIETFLTKRMQKQETAMRLTDEWIRLLESQQGLLSVSDLSEELQLNRRTLERYALSQIGMTPKLLARMMRLQATLRYLIDHPEASFTEIALIHEFYDQAHFTKEFKYFTGVSPKHFFANQLRFSSLFIGKD